MLIVGNNRTVAPSNVPFFINTISATTLSIDRERRQYELKQWFELRRWFELMRCYGIRMNAFEK